MRVGNEFRIADLIATLVKRTRTSFVFDLGVKTDSFAIRDLHLTLGPDRVHHVIGWMDVHFPVGDDHELFVRVGLPADRISQDFASTLAFELRNQFDVPPDSYYSVRCYNMAGEHLVSRTREGAESYAGPDGG